MVVGNWMFDRASRLGCGIVGIENFGMNEGSLLLKSLIAPRSEFRPLTVSSIPVRTPLAALVTRSSNYAFVSTRQIDHEDSRTSWTAPIRIDKAPLTTSSRKHRNVDRYMSTMKLMIASITVSARMRAARAPCIVPLTALAIRWLVAVAIYLGKFTTTRVAFSAA